jgi:hypothetical protein
MKTHYRKVFKSDHLGVADLEEFLEEGKSLSFTIREVKQEIGAVVAGRKGDYNIAYFYENIKPLVLNSTNSKTVSRFNKGSSFVEDWNDTRVDLTIDRNVRMKGAVVGGVRISPLQPKEKVKPSFTEAQFEKAKAAKATIEQIKKAYSITKAIEKKYLDYGAEK